MKATKSVSGKIVFAVGLLLLSVTSVQAAERTPEDMKCDEFVNLNPKAMAPVAFWMLSDKTTYKGGDTVSLKEKVNVSVPQIVDFCEKNKEKPVYEFRNKLQDLVVH
ncbi:MULTISPECIES: HdeA/HdeB family chaperone [Winslowiella]|uniref:HdeA/HdeB family chaperone n=1 Tax=Winslowiella TaxID=2997349 RepID=UPI0028BD4377|nr:HdeA/HdeB family chaperone [Winslowiella toletana]WNN42451.1 HdeA/HdeB family chaperone [Winslowiella toletana]